MQTYRIEVQQPAGDWTLITTFTGSSQQLTNELSTVQRTYHMPVRAVDSSGRLADLRR